MIRIETDRLVIRESSGRDFSRIYAMLLSEGNAGPDENEELEKYLAYIHTAYPVFGFGLWSVVLKETGDVIGWCGLQPIGNEDTPLGRIELGYLIDREFRRKGYACEACRAIMDYAFQRLELDEVYVQIDGQNKQSLRLAQRLGFTKAGDGLWVQSCDAWLA